MDQENTYGLNAIIYLMVIIQVLTLKKIGL